MVSPGDALARRVSAALAFVGLHDRARDRVSTYSGGMKRRLNLAVALVHEPELVVLDEPTVGVDPQSRNLIFDNIRALRAQGRTIVYTTHYMEEAERLCDRVGIIDRGRLLALGTVAGLVAAHGVRPVLVAEFEAPSGDSQPTIPWPRSTRSPPANASLRSGWSGPTWSRSSST